MGWLRPKAENVKINIQMKIDGAEIYLTLRELSPKSIPNRGGKPEIVLLLFTPNVPEGLDLGSSQVKILVR